MSACGCITNVCAINENFEQEFGDLIHSFIHFFIKQIFVECLLIALHCAQFWER